VLRVITSHINILYTHDSESYIPNVPVLGVIAILLHLHPKINLSIMGKGDIKTKRGKIINGSYGVSRPHKTKKAEAPVAKKSAKTKKG
jgi:30S ribosomal protein S31